MVKERATFCLIQLIGVFLDLPSHQQKMLWGLVMFEKERFASVHWQNIQTVTHCQVSEGIHGSYVTVLHHHVPVVSRCDIFMVWETPNGLYSFLKQQGCCLSVCNGWQPSSRRADFKGTCMGCLLGMEHMCTCSYFLWDTSSELILFPFPLIELNRSSTGPFYFNHHVANAGGETATAVIPPWLKVKICAFMLPTFR